MRGFALLKAQIHEAWLIKSFTNWTGKSTSGTCTAFQPLICLLHAATLGKTPSYSNKPAGVCIMPSPIIGLAPKRVLIVEDEAVVRATMKMALAAGGHTVWVAETGEAALTMFEEIRPDLVLTDFLLAEIDGLELAAAIRERAPQQPIILVTAFADKARSMDKVSHVNAVIGKPFSLAELYRALAEVFPERKAGEH